MAPGECDPECPPVQETVGAPAAVQSIVEQKVILPATEGVTLHLAAWITGVGAISGQDDLGVVIKSLQQLFGTKNPCHSQITFMFGIFSGDKKKVQRLGSPGAPLVTLVSAEVSHPNRSVPLCQDHVAQLQSRTGMGSRIIEL